MKTSKRMIALVGIGMLFALLTDGTSGCGGGGGGNSSSAPVSSESLAEEAQTLLGEGDITGAQAKYDASLAADPKNSQAAFGAAFTRLLVLPESSPAKKILGELGQGELKVSNVVGPTGYLAALDEINKSETAIDSVAGPFYGSAVAYSSDWTTTDWEQIENEYDACVEACSYDYDCRMQCEDSADAKRMDPSVYGMTLNCSRKSVEMDFRDANNTLQVEANLSIFGQSEKNGTILSNFQLKEGDIFEIGAETGMTRCASGRIVNLWVRSGDSYDYYYDDYNDPADASGTFTLRKGGSTIGEGFELQLSNVTLANWEGKTITLNGTLKDVITEKEPRPADYFPFAETVEAMEGKGKLPVMLAKARDGLTTTDLIAETMDFIPLFQEIKELLAQADKDNDFQFIIPRRLYFGNKEIPINRIDLKGIRAGIDMALAGFYLAGSWSFEIEIGSLYDEEGNKLYTEEGIVEQLNRFFELKSDHHLDEAQIAIAEGLQNLLDAYDLISVVATDGIIEEAPGTVAGYAEFRDVVSIIQKSLSEQQLFPYVDPVVNISLNSFFNNPPDASKIDFDPFVIEDGRIKPVEAFFEQMLEGAIDIDLTKTYRKAFIALQDSDLGKAVFDEFENFFVAGRHMNILPED